MTIQSKLRFSNARKAIAAVAIFGFVALGAFGQEGGKIVEGGKIADKPGAAATPSPGLLLEWAGVARVGNPYDVAVDVQLKDGKKLLYKPVVYTQLDDKAGKEYKKLVGGSVYFAVFKNQGAQAAKDGDTFGTGMKDFDKKFFGGNGHQFSPAFDTTATYLYVYQIVSGRGRDPRNFINEPSDIKLVGGDEEKEFHRVSPPAEPIARWALSLAVRPRDISSWGYFSGASFVAKPKELRTIFGVKKDEGRIEAVSYLPSIQMETLDPIYKNRALAQSLGALQETFHIGPSTTNIAKDPAYVKNEIKLVVDGKETTKDTGHDVNPSSVQLVHDASENMLYGEAAMFNAGMLNDADIIRSALLVKFDDGGLKAAGLTGGQYSTVFGFTSNLPPQPERVRIDTKESVIASRPFESRAADLFARRALDAAESYSAKVLLAASENRVAGVPSLLAFSREPSVRLVADIGAGGVVGAGGVAPAGGVVNVAGTAGPGSLRTAGEIVAAGGNIKFVAAPGSESREIPGPTPGAPGAAAIGGGFSTGLGGISSGGGAGGSFPTLGAGGGLGLSGGIGGGGVGGSSGQQQQPQQTQQQQQQVPNSQTINFNASLTNQQKQQQAQGQFQNQGQHQGNHNHPGHPSQPPHGAVVPAPASLLLGLLGLPALFLLRRRKTEESPAAIQPIA